MSAPRLHEDRVELVADIGLDKLLRNPPDLDVVGPIVIGAEDSVEYSQDSRVMGQTGVAPGQAIGPLANGLQVEVYVSSSSADGGGKEVVSRISKVKKNSKKPKKVSLLLGAARCINLKEIASQHNNQRGKGVLMKASIKKRRRW
jgi:hypothetical protein